MDLTSISPRMMNQVPAAANPGANAGTGAVLDSIRESRESGSSVSHGGSGHTPFSPNPAADPGVLGASFDLTGEGRMSVRLLSKTQEELPLQGHGNSAASFSSGGSM